MKVGEYRVMRQDRGVPIVGYTRKAYLRRVVHAIRMCMCKAMAPLEEEGIYIFYTKSREHPRDYDEIHHSFDSNSPCQYIHMGSHCNQSQIDSSSSTDILGMIQM